MISEERTEYLCKKYRRGRDLDDEDCFDVHCLALIGFFRITVSLKRRKAVAKTATLGLML